MFGHRPTSLTMIVLEDILLGDPPPSSAWPMRASHPLLSYFRLLCELIFVAIVIHNFLQKNSFSAFKFLHTFLDTSALDKYEQPLLLSSLLFLKKFFFFFSKTL